MQIFIRYGKEEFSIILQHNILIAQLKLTIQDIKLIPVSKQQLIYSGEILFDHMRLSDYHIEDSSLIFLVAFDDFEDGLEQICVICRMDIDGECMECGFYKYDDCRVATGVCGHRFHFHCIGRWLEKKQNCPLCEDDSVWRLFVREKRGLREGFVRVGMDDDRDLDAEGTCYDHVNEVAEDSDEGFGGEIMRKKANVARECSYCGSEESTKYCARCYTVRYCCKACQSNHWPTHKKDCKKV
eukprot:TRINITY_DN128_c1_g1_i1.p1 TRINITY_DN128_c1_g1~~TRINITY_DN128_c1_g1_i1.p1  ORF type:complete len:241 (+),score=45.32 TRINITY_DN128_c1_g1_i1:109-831(+)